MLAFRVTNHSCALTAPEMSLTLCMESAGSSGQAHLQSKAGGTAQTASGPTHSQGQGRGLADSSRSLTAGSSQSCPSHFCFPLSDPCFWLPHIFINCIHQAEKWLPPAWP